MMTPQLSRSVRVCAIAGVLLLDACGDGGDARGDNAARDHDDTSDSRGAAEPPGTRPEDVQPYVAELLAQHDDVVNQIIADPGVAADRDDLLIQQYLSLYEPGSEIAESAIAAWTASGAAGESVRPFNADHPTNRLRLDGSIETMSDDEVRFPTCNDRRYLIYDAQGRVIEQAEQFEQPGEGLAVRVEGDWRLRRLDAFDGTAGCRTEGE